HASSGYDQVWLSCPWATKASVKATDQLLRLAKTLSVLNFAPARFLLICGDAGFIRRSSWRRLRRASFPFLSTFPSLHHPHSVTTVAFRPRRCIRPPTGWGSHCAHPGALAG